MGGLIVLKYALEKGDSLEFNGVISCSPAIKNATPINPFKYWGGRLFGPLMPKMSVKTGLDTSNISRVPEVVKSYNKDALVHHYISLKTGI